MLNVYQVPLEDIQKVEWQGDSALFDYSLSKLSNTHTKFLIVNPQWRDLKLYTLIDSIPVAGRNKCIVWKFQGEWIAKLFDNNHWSPADGYLDVIMDPILLWERNPIFKNIVFENDPSTRPLDDMYDLPYELVWHLDPMFNPTDDKIWVIKCKLFNNGFKDMGYVSPKTKKIINPDLPKLEFVDNYIIPWYDLQYDHVWGLTDNEKFTWVKKLTSTYNPVGTKYIEINYPAHLDVIFISYNEPNAEENWQRVLEKAPHAKRVNGVKGIFNAHKAAAELATTDMFYVVDGDAYITDDYNFTFQPTLFDRDCVHVWHSNNPINNLTYGYGGVKLFPRSILSTSNLLYPDIATSITEKFKVVDEVSNITRFNTNAFSTWRSAFRECVKLSSKIVQGQINNETENRLDSWCNIGKDRPFGNFAINGARAGKKYGTKHKDDLIALNKINDYGWLEEQFKNNI